MSIAQKEQQLRGAVSGLTQLPFGNVRDNPPVLNDWEGLSFPDFLSTLDFVLETFSICIEKDLLKELPFTTLNSLTSQVINATPHAQQFINTPNQGTFQNAANTMDSLAYHIRLFRVDELAHGSVDFASLESFYDSESQKLVTANKEAAALIKNVQNLIEPAVSGSLSKSFNDRREKLFIGRLLWLLATVVVAYFASRETLSFVDLTEKHLDLFASGKALNEKTIYLPILFIRSIVLMLLYGLFGFAFSQYKKERDLEEEYAHKAAVATSLPNYGDLARQDSVRDQIVTGASNVIFASPTKNNSESDKNKDAVSIIDSLKGFVDTLGKVAPK